MYELASRRTANISQRPCVVAMNSRGNTIAKGRLHRTVNRSQVTRHYVVREQNMFRREELNTLGWDKSLKSSFMSEKFVDPENKIIQMINWNAIKNALSNKKGLVFDKVVDTLKNLAISIWKHQPAALFASFFDVLKKAKERLAVMCSEDSTKEDKKVACAAFVSEMVVILFRLHPAGILPSVILDILKDLGELGAVIKNEYDRLVIEQPNDLEMDLLQEHI